MPFRTRITDVLPALAMAIGLAQPLSAAVAGVPEEPRPGTLPTVWLGWSNDSFGGELGVNSDDYRTNAFNSGVRLGPHWVLAVDYSMMTYLRVLGSELRSDEITATLGYRYDLPALAHTWIAAGAGVRIADDFSGESLQNTWHDVWDYDQVHVAYEEGGSAAVGYLAAGWAWIPEIQIYPALDQRLGLYVHGSALGSTEGEINSALTANVAAVGRDAAFWLGLRQQYNGGDQLTYTASRVADHESGTLLLVGTSAGGWYFEGSTNLQNKATQGRIGFMWQRGSSLKQQQIAEVEGILGLYDGYALGLQYRWRPAWLDEATNSHASLMIDYRFGQYPGINWYGNNVIVRQPLIGMDVVMFPPRDGFQVTPFAYVGAGVREERVEQTDVNALFPTDKAVRGVVQGGLGVRCYWGALPQDERTARYGVSLVYDVWQPFSDATVSNGVQTGIYQERNAAMGVRLAATVAW